MRKGRTRLRIWLVSPRAVDGGQERLAGREAAQVLDEEPCDQPVPRRVESADVGKDHDAVGRPER